MRQYDGKDNCRSIPIDLDQPFHHLSGGQKTKILLAKTVIFPTDFFLFDEPTNNLDSESRPM